MVWPASVCPVRLPFDQPFQKFAFNRSNTPFGGFWQLWCSFLKNR
jgi:hypothetical protein